MRPLYDEFDEFEFDDSVAVKQLLREMEREEIRMAGRRKHSPGNKKRWNDEFEDEFPDDEFEDYEEYDDYDDNEFDSYSGLDISR